MDIGLISEKSESHWPFSRWQALPPWGCRLGALPLRIVPLLVRREARALGQATDYLASVQAIALAPALRSLLKRALQSGAYAPQQYPLPPLIDGNLCRIALLPQLLDYDLPGWRQQRLAIPCEHRFNRLAARFLAAEGAALLLYGAPRPQLEALGQQIYQESGSIPAALPPDTEPPAELWRILPPFALEQGGQHWRNWPHELISKNDRPLALHFAEALLYAEGRLRGQALSPAFLQALNRRTRQLGWHLSRTPPRGKNGGLGESNG